LLNEPSEGFPRLEHPFLKAAAHRQIANRRALRGHRRHRCQQDARDTSSPVTFGAGSEAEVAG
jgi:hypothetical protein